MKKLLILSGKGGTGKTSIASSFIRLGEIKAFADCDVDAPNLELLIGGDGQARERDFYGMDQAFIDQARCTDCGLCLRNCAFSAIKREEDGYQVDPYSCEGCGLCQRLCRSQAISMVDKLAGSLRLYKKDRLFSTARLKMGEGNSGLLVSQVKKELDGLDQEIALIDGSPGIGCPVIASIRGVDLVLIVAEPSRSGISDLKRIVETSRGFKVEVLVLINKYDLSLENTARIEDYCQEEGIELAGKIPFDPEVVRSLNRGESLLEVESLDQDNLIGIYRRTLTLLKD